MVLGRPKGAVEGSRRKRAGKYTASQTRASSTRPSVGMLMGGTREYLMLLERVYFPQNIFPGELVKVLGDLQQESPSASKPSCF